MAWVRTLGSAAVYATLIVTFGFQVARVEGQSMAPTLQDQDRLIVNKAVYQLSSPGRGDIVMLYYPVNPDKSFVKRVIAEEGDTVKITDGRVFVNDLPLDDSYVPPEYRSHDDWGPQVIPDGYYFVMGDHRNNSSDSRHWGMVPKRYIIGRCRCGGGRSRKPSCSEERPRRARGESGAVCDGLAGVELLDDAPPSAARRSSAGSSAWASARRLRSSSPSAAARTA